MQISIFIFINGMLLLFMIFNHIVDDFNQGFFLSTYKQKIMWEKDEIGKLEKYKNDYKICLITHSFKWAMVIHIPIFIVMTILFLTNNTKQTFEYHCIYLLIFFLFSIITDTVIHYLIDDMKANQYLINLIQDQMFHLVQIFVTWLFYVCIIYYIIYGNAM